MNIESVKSVFIFNVFNVFNVLVGGSFTSVAANRGLL